MPTGAITGYIDVAQLTLYAFWIFFAGLIFYLRREDKREGYPLDSDRSDIVRVQGFPSIPKPKIFHLANGQTRMAPRPEGPATILARPLAPWPGAPLVPTGRPMLDGVGPAAYAGRDDVPDSEEEGGGPKLQPMRLATEFFVADEDPDPRGMPVIGADGFAGGVVADLWVDRSEVLVRYLEIETPMRAGEPGRRVLLPLPLARVSLKRGQVRVKSVLGAQFADAPGLANPDVVTKREEDRISAYYGGGNIYADPLRLGPVL